MEQSLTKVILADDLAVFRAGLAEILAAEPDMMVAAEAGDYSQLQRAIKQHAQAVVISASHLQPTVSTLVKQIRASHGRCILLTQPGESEAAYLVQGVDAVLPRDSSAPAFLSVIRGVGLRDELMSAPASCFTPLMGEDACPHHVAAAKSNVDQHLRQRLTPKEIKILSLVVEGCSCKQIAVRLTTPEQAVKNYLRALLNSTESADLSELAEFTVTHRLLEPTYYPSAYTA